MQSDEVPSVPREVQAVDQELAARNDALLRELREGLARLVRLGEEIGEARRRLRDPLAEAWMALQVAEAERSAL